MHVTPLYVTWHEKTTLMCTKHTSLHYLNYLTFCVSYSYTSSVNGVGFPIVSSTIIISKSFIDILCLDKKLLKFKLYKSCQILCVHISSFLMPGHIYNIIQKFCIGVHKTSPIYRGTAGKLHTLMQCSIPLLYRKDFALPTQNFSSIIQEEFYIPYAKFLLCTLPWQSCLITMCRTG